MLIDDVFQCNRPEFRNYKVTNSSKGLFEVLDQTHVILYPLRSQHCQLFLPAVLKMGAGPGSEGNAFPHYIDY